MKEDKIKNMIIKQDDFVKLIRTEPSATGKVVQVFDNKVAIVRWHDGILAEHFVDELRLIRLDEITGPWLAF